jgi:membrane protease YdiL (CAAX protease family)
MALLLFVVVATTLNIWMVALDSPITAPMPWGPQAGLAVAILTACVFPPIAEEIFFRGFLSRGLIARHGVLLGTIFATALFAMVHFPWPARPLAVFVMGLAMQLMFLATRSLLASILFHLSYNAAAIGISRWHEQLSHLGSPLLLLMAVAVLASCGVVLYQTRTRWILPNGLPWSPGYFATEMPPEELQAVPHSGRATLAAKVAAGTAVAAFVVAAVVPIV